jgi:alpha-D-xyloside xylohydrolase
MIGRHAFLRRAIFLFCSFTVINVSFFPSQANAANKAPKPAVKHIANGVQLTTGDLNLKVQFCSDATVRILKWTSGGTANKNSLSVIQKNVPPLKIRLEKGSGSLTLTSPSLKVQVAENDGSVHFLASDGHTLLQEGQSQLAPSKIEKGAFSLQQNWALTPEEGVYGLGQHQYGDMNYRGKTVKLVQANRNSASPFFISTAGYGIFWDNYSETVFADDLKTTSLWSEVGDNIDYYFFYGPSMDQVIAGYRHLTGEAPLYGKWAYGYWQSKEHYGSREEVMSIAKEFRTRQIPIDNIVQDWQYWGGNENWSGMFFDEKTYPQPKEMMDQLHQQGYHMIVSIWGGLGPASPIAKEMDKRGWLFPTVGWGGFKFYDAYNPAARDLYWKYANDGLFSKGVDGWWMDSTEPDIVNALTEDGEAYEMKRVQNNYLGSFARYLNTYPLMTVEGVYQHQRQVSDRKRVYILTRSTFAGQQRAAATTWTGDIGASWDIYRKQISAGVNHSMSGIPYWTLDVGAFFLGGQGGVFTNGGHDHAYQELFTRMYQFGAFAPIFRTHGTDFPREPWQFPEYSDTLVKFDNLRYRLLPYIYSLGWKVTHDGYSIMRGLPMDFTADRKTYSIDDQFMFGPSIMAAPVTEYMYHRPPEAAVLLAPEFLATKDGRPGLEAKYYCDDKFQSVCHEGVESDINLDWYTGWPSFITSPKFSMQWTGKLVPKQTGIYRFVMKAWGPKRLYIDGKEIPHHYSNVEADTVPVDLVAGQKYDMTFETSNSALGAFRAMLYWKTPDILAKEASVEPREKTRSVYLPQGGQWIDFWTGEALEGGKNVVVDAPIEKMPLMIKAGSIIPMGPFIQYSTEKPADPIELRIYPGADGSFNLYEDENDNYDYEKGAYATIDFHWDDAKHLLTIDDRKGSFPGMLKARTFNVVIVGKDHGTGVELASHADKTVAYEGTKLTVELAH